MNKRVTSHDVARLAGVSQPTVSRALRNLPGTSVETRSRVLAAAHHLAYVPSTSGRTLSTRRTRRIAIVAEELTNPFYPQLVEPLRHHLAEHGYGCVLVTERSSGSLTVDDLADGSYDGVALCTVSRTSSLPRDLTERGVPHVLVNRVLDVPESSSCSFDNRAGARELGRLVARLGHVRVGAIQGPTEFSTGRQRAVGLREGLREHGLHVRRELTRRVRYTYEGGFRAAQDLLTHAVPPTALFCGNDVVAIGALAAAGMLGIRVPEQLSIVGFDDIDMAGWGMIGLTTIRCDLEALAREAVTLLQQAIDGAPARQVVLPIALERRRTHGPAPGR
jgi:LacI family transcriptional regulator